MAESTASMRRASWWQVGLSGVAIALILATLYYTRRAAVSAHEAAAASKLAVSVGADAVGVARDAAKRELRAYMTFKKVDIDWKEDDPASRVLLTIRFENVGKTPAHRTWLLYNLNNDGAPPKFSELKRFRNPTPFDVGPGQFYTQPAFSPPIASDVKTRLKEGKAEFFVWGTLVYADAFGTRRTSQFRVVFREKEFRLAPEGNTME